ncbi:hypothetical protein ABH935_003299 [Catenulispora sp. GAS73]|uniref:hypothetical protein n=1 Tax=Catenulispora sp. GAS73 TaxID=3156269 RepID=UPI00351279F9
MWAEYSKDDDRVRVFYMNSGSGPVYNIQGKGYVAGEVAFTFHRGTHGPTSTPVEEWGFGTIVAAHVTQTLRELYGTEEVDGEDLYGDPRESARVMLKREELHDQITIDMTFRDASGRVWRRTQDGTLVQLSRRETKGLLQQRRPMD